MGSRRLRLALVGFGHVGRAFARLLPGAFARGLRDAGLAPVVTGIATSRHGSAIDPRGLDLAAAEEIASQGGDLRQLHRGRPPRGTLEFVASVPADVLLEVTPLDPRRGEPATRHVRRALERGLHVVTANKGPVAFSLSSLLVLARRRRRRFLFEGAVMDGVPVFNLVRSCLPGVRVLGFRGVLNTTTTRILAGVESGRRFEDALADARRDGVAEADPSLDVDGWDAAVKTCALANALLDASLRPDRLARRGIAGLRPAAVRAARRSGGAIRLVARARRAGRRVAAQVGPERLAAFDVLASERADGVLVLETDLLGEIGIYQGPSGVEQTAYALFSDLLSLAAPRR
jgi:homoserine dehydrogenase